LSRLAAEPINIRGEVEIDKILQIKDWSEDIPY
jgi:hypothetical protein